MANNALLGTKEFADSRLAKVLEHTSGRAKKLLRVLSKRDCNGGVATVAFPYIRNGDKVSNVGLSYKVRSHPTHSVSSGRSPIRRFIVDLGDSRYERRSVDAYSLLVSDSKSQVENKSKPVQP